MAPWYFIYMSCLTLLRLSHDLENSAEHHGFPKDVCVNKKKARKVLQNKSFEETIKKREK